MYYFSPRRLSLASRINSTMMMMMMTAILLRRQRITTTATTVTSFTDRACRSSCFHSMTAILTRKRSSTTRASKWAVVRTALTRSTDTSAILVTEAGRSLNRMSKTFDSTLQHYQHQQVSWNNRFRYNTLLKSMQLQRHQCRMLSTVTGDASSSPPNIIIPRAAVSVAVRVQCDIQKDDDDDINAASDSHEIDNVKQLTFYLFIQRGTEPSKGMWSLPGGKIEYPETTFQAAQRELYEETQWSTNADKNKDRNTGDPLQWYNETVLTTDAIGDGYHYVIAHYFAKYPNIPIPMDPVLHSMKAASGRTTTFDETMEGYITNIRQQYLPIVLASDDAADAQWYTMKEIYDMEINLATTTCGVSRVLQRMEMCDRANLLD